MKIRFNKEFIYPIILALPFLILELITISQYKQLPGPLYGGDIYWHYGETVGIYEGRLPWTNPQVAGEWAYYGWLTQTIIAAFGHIAGDIFIAYIYFALLETILFSYAAYFLGKAIFGKWQIAAFLAALWLKSNILYQPSIGGLGSAAMIPIFMAFLYYAFVRDGIKSKILVGLFMGLASLSHISILPALLLLLFVIFLYRGWLSTWRISSLTKEISISVGERKFRDGLRFVGPILIVGTLIALLFWGPILFVYKLQAPNPVNEYANIDLRKHGLSTAYDMIVEPFFSISSIMSGNWYGFIFSLLVLYGLYLVMNGKTLAMRFTLLVLIAGFIAGLHYFVTLPLFGKALLPNYLYGVLMPITTNILVVFAILDIVKRVTVKGLNALLIVFLIIFTMYPIVQAADTSNNKWVNVGKTKGFVFADVAKWVKENTNMGDTFLSHEELAFAINGMTARQVLTSRRTHFSPFLDINSRTADAAVILYGNDSAKTRNLLEKYRIDYFYWDANAPYFIQNEPLMTEPKYADYLSAYGVKFSHVNTYLDPAFDVRYPKYDMLAVSPAPDDATKPWSEEFEKHLKPAKTFEIDGQTFAIVYEIIK